MSAFFVDTSALVKRYIRETGSLWVRSWITPESDRLIVVSDLAVVEMFSLFARRKRARTISVSATTRLRQTFIADLDHDYILLTVNAVVFDHAREIAFVHGLKALDALQLASAIRAQDALQESLAFISGDTELLAAAAAEGFAVDNPLDHTD